MCDIKSKLSNKFKRKDIGKVRDYIGIEIEYSQLDDSVMTLSQKRKYKIKNA